jgi:hypothetical protein
MRLRALLLLGSVVGCTAKPAQIPDQARSALPSPPVIDIVALDYAFQAPDTIPGGWVTLRLQNKGKELHHATLLRLAEGKTVADFAKLDPMAAPPPWLEAAGGPPAATPGGTESTTAKLEPGSYVLVCMVPSPDGKRHIMKGMVKPVTVIAPAAAAQVPTADIAVTLSDFAFEFAPRLTAGKHIIRVIAAPGQPHELLMVRLPPRKKAEDVAAWVEKMVGPPPIEGIAGGSSPLAGSAVNFFDVDLKPGDYAILCFVPDAKDGKPHSAHGMIKTLTIQ